MFPSIKEKKVLITGASGGIGSSIAQLFSSSDAIVGIHYSQDEKEAHKILNSIRRKKREAKLFKANLLDSKERDSLIKSFVEAFGSIDMLVNNAGGITGTKHFLELDEDSWNATLSICLKAPFFLSQKAFEIMRKQRSGRIINISSVGVKFGGSPYSFHYAAAKAGLEAITRGLAKEGAPYNILVNAIRPGVIDTSFHKKIGRSTEKMKKRVALIPLGKFGKPIDIAQMVLYLSSAYGDFITGQIFTISGGE